MGAINKNQKVFVAMSLKKSLRDLTGQAGGAKKPKIFVAMSGGVDSSVAAALLKKEGYDVAGVFMRFWQTRIDADGIDADRCGRDNSCCSVEAEAAALAVAQKLRIPFYVFNFEKEFKKKVVDDFLTKERAGLTPNPCVVCNPKIKFGLFLDKALALGADYVATGHYAKISFIPDVILRAKPEGSLAYASRHSSEIPPASTRRQGEAGRYARNDKKALFKLFAAKDKQKDQSYFLYGLNQAQLSKTIFPLGDFKKEEVVKLAKKWQLPFYSHESFDLCFVGASHDKFIKKYLGLKPGKIVSVSVIPARFAEAPARRAKAGIQKSRSRVPPPLKLWRASKPGMTKEMTLGQHQGLALYTIGQRAAVGGPGPFYVVKKDIKNNILYVSNNEKDLYSKEMMVGSMNWISGRAPKMPWRCGFKTRYQSVMSYGLIRTNMPIKKKNSKVLFDRPQRAITPGQSAVFYGKNGEVLGGGVIKN